MKQIAPSYYQKFTCIGSKCRHNCCIGWEIDVDGETDAYYKTVGGELGKRLAENIDRSDETPHFKLCDGERCPFLNKDNLCDIIITLGEGRLCQICADHPRYRNFYSDRIEIGLGLCCEAAAELILNNKEKVTLVTLSDDGEDDPIDSEDEMFFALREKIFSIIQNREWSINDRIKCLLDSFELSMPAKNKSEWVDIFLSLEMLDAEWGVRLNKLKSTNTETRYENELECEQLLVYFIYRHLADGLFDGKINERIKFAVRSLDMILSIAAATGESMSEIARAYSSEIEYSEENLERLLACL